MIPPPLRLLGTITLLTTLDQNALAQQTAVDPAKLSPGGSYQHATSSPRLSPAEQRRLSLKPRGPGRWTIEQIRIDKPTRTISLPIVLEQTEGALEYALVGIRGKLHESLFATDALPAQIHYGTKLLGIKNGTPVDITLSWNTHGPKRSLKLSEILRIKLPDHPPVEWIYHARLRHDGSLIAQSEQSLITLIADDSALIRHRAAAHVNRDDIYFTRQTSPDEPPLLPAKGLPMTLTFTFALPAK